MPINLGGSGLRGSGGLRRHAHDEELDPASGIVNLVDVMLVFSCGLMVAIITNWNVNVGNVQQLNDAQVTEISDVNETVAEITASGTSYDELGTAYQDPETGTIYLLSDESSSTDTSDSSSTSSSGAVAEVDTTE